MVGLVVEKFDQCTIAGGKMMTEHLEMFSERPRDVSS